MSLQKYQKVPEAIIVWNRESKTFPLSLCNGRKHKKYQKHKTQKEKHFRSVHYNGKKPTVLKAFIVWNTKSKTSCCIHVKADDKTFYSVYVTAENTKRTRGIYSIKHRK
jgi:hypothetical protein